MPPIPKAIKPKLKCIKFGEILIDENKKVVLLCVNCSEDFNLLADFCKHLKDCEPAKNIFQTSKPGTKLFCDTGNLLTNVKQKSRELLIYGVNEKRTVSDICDIEAEILNPRWYTDAAASSPIRTLNKNSATYNNLIEEVTPFVQFKENVRLLSTPKQNITSKQDKIVQCKTKTNVAQEKRPPLPNTTTATKANNMPTNETNRLVKRTLSVPSKPNCAKNLSNTSISNIANPNLKRKSTTEVINQSTATANQQLAAQPAVKRARHIVESSALCIKQKPAPKDNLAKICMNKQTTIGIKKPPQTIQIQPQIVINSQQTAALKKPLTNVVSTQKPPSSSQIHTIQQNLPKPVIGSTTALMTAPALPATTNNKQTVDILNKLQTLGLKVQRTNPAQTPPIIPKEENTAAMEIIKKLQSKGMEVKRVPKTSQTTVRVLVPQTLKTPPKPSPTTVNVKNSNSSINAIKHSTNTVLKNFLIRKCN